MSVGGATTKCHLGCSTTLLIPVTTEALDKRYGTIDLFAMLLRRPDPLRFHQDSALFIGLDTREVATALFACRCCLIPRYVFLKKHLAEVPADLDGVRNLFVS